MDFSLEAKEQVLYDVVIIGGGPGGASAALYTARADLKTLVIDKGLTAGALGITTKISNYPGVPGPISGEELVKIMREQAESFGAEFMTDKVVGASLDGDVKMVFAGPNTYNTKTIILATGSMGRTGSTPGEEKLLGRGVSYCATCDAAFFREQDVAVIGNNDEALEEALFLTKFVAKVYLIVPIPDLKASENLVTEVEENPKIEISLATRLKEIIGEDQVSGIRIHPRTRSELATGVRVHPRTQGEYVLPVTGAFVYLQGGKPITDYLMEQLELGKDGCLEMGKNMETAVSGVYAIGDLLCDHIKQAVLASADGVLAAIAADKYINKRNKVRTDWKK